MMAMPSPSSGSATFSKDLSLTVTPYATPTNAQTSKAQSSLRNLNIAISPRRPGHRLMESRQHTEAPDRPASRPSLSDVLTSRQPQFHIFDRDFFQSR